MYRLAHLSDPHLGPLPDARIRELMSKRVIGYVNWHRNRAGTHTADHLTTLLADMAEQTPDHIAVTGDLVNLSLKAEIEPARAWLESLGPPHDVTAIPGNHDAYVPGSVQRAIKSWRPFMTGDTPARDGNDFPFVRRRGPLAIVALSSANASAPFMATGVFDSRQARALCRTLESLRAENLFRVVLIHHPPVRSRKYWHRRLIGTGHFSRAIREAGAELVLHGHTHVDSLVWTDSDTRPVPIIGVPSASNAPGDKRPAARYNLFDVEKTDDGWTCAMTERGLTLPGRPVSEIRSRRLVYSPGATVSEDVSEPVAASG